MISSIDPFALEFDSIVVPDPKLADRTLDDPFLRLDGLDADVGQAGYALIDDACGRFTIDPATGVISLADEALLALEPGALHMARVRVVEPSGGDYELSLLLKITGRVPQLADEADDFAFLPAPPEVLGLETDAKPARPWALYDAFRCVDAELEPLCNEQSGDEHAAFGALVVTPVLRKPQGEVELALGAELPRPAPRHAHWPY